MDRTKKYTVPKQIRSLIFTYLSISFIMIILTFSLLDVATKYAAVKIILTAIMLFITVMWTFSSAYECASTDYKTYVPLTPYPAKGFVLSTGIAALIIASWIFYEIMWIVKPMGENFEPLTFAATGIYLFITSPFSTLVNLQGKDADLLGQILSVVIPVITCAAGYFCGYKKWDYTKYMKVIMFDKKNEKKNEKKK